MVRRWPTRSPSRAPNISRPPKKSRTRSRPGCLVGSAAADVGQHLRRRGHHHGDAEDVDELDQAQRRDDAATACSRRARGGGLAARHLARPLTVRRATRPRTRRTRRSTMHLLAFPGRSTGPATRRPAQRPLPPRVRVTTPAAPSRRARYREGTQPSPARQLPLQPGRRRDRHPTGLPRRRRELTGIPAHQRTDVGGHHAVVGKSRCLDADLVAGAVEQQPERCGVVTGGGRSGRPPAVAAGTPDRSAGTWSTGRGRGSGRPAAPPATVPPTPPARGRCR